MVENIDIGEIAGTIVFDLRKAFDVVDHEILLKKLNSHKFDNSVIKWMQSYLTNRRQCIVDENASSSMQEAKSGVPQGSVLSPVRFLIFINDMRLFINDNGELYADDVTFHAEHKDQTSLKFKIALSVSNHGALNIKCSWTYIVIKTSSMTIGTRQNLSNIQNINQGKYNFCRLNGIN